MVDAEEAKEGWTSVYDHSLTHCMHGEHCHAGPQCQVGSQSALGLCLGVPAGLSTHSNALLHSPTRT